MQNLFFYKKLVLKYLYTKIYFEMLFKIKIMMLIQVVLPVATEFEFSYFCSKKYKISLGSRVIVPFKNLKLIGIIFSFNQKINLKKCQIKQIYKIIDKKSLFTPGLWKTLFLASEYYHLTFGKILFYVLPNLLKKGYSSILKERKKWVITKLGSEINLETLNNTPKQKKILTLLRRIKHIKQNRLKDLNIKENIFKKLFDRGFCELKKISKDQKEKYHKEAKKKIFFPTLNFQQKKILRTIYDKKNIFSVFLLNIAIESIKNEIYLKIFKHTLFKKKQILILVPEIYLIKKIYLYIKKFFQVSIYILHSKLSNKEKKNIWIKTKNGNIDILIGTRSSILLPFLRLGIIFIEKEHSIFYKEKKVWKYHARDLAILRAKEENIPIIMHSISPTLESLFNVRKKKYIYINYYKEKNKKIDCTTLIDVRRKKLISGLSEIAIEKIHQHVLKKNQVLLFLNKKGSYSKLFCYTCGWVAKCKKCNFDYTLYENKKKLLCHVCNDKKKLPKDCVICKSKNLYVEGIGVEEIENQLNNLFPQFKTLYIDNDITNKKNLQKSIKKIFFCKIQILITTHNILAKNYFFPNITLFLLVNIDNFLLTSDFRSIERFAQFYSELNLNFQKEIILQTSYPYQILLRNLIFYDYNVLANILLKERKKLNLPPFNKHAIFRVQNCDLNKIIDFLYRIRTLFQMNTKDKNFWISIPMPSLLEKKNKKYRWQLLIQHSSRIILHKILKISLKKIKMLPEIKKMQWIIDIDPIEY